MVITFNYYTQWLDSIGDFMLEHLISLIFYFILKQKEFDVALTQRFKVER